MPETAKRLGATDATTAGTNVVALRPGHPAPTDPFTPEERMRLRALLQDAARVFNGCPMARQMISKD